MYDLGVGTDAGEDVSCPVAVEESNVLGNNIVEEIKSQAVAKSFSSEPEDYLLDESADNADAQDHHPLRQPIVDSILLFVVLLCERVDNFADVVWHEDVRDRSQEDEGESNDQEVPLPSHQPAEERLGVSCN